MFSRRRVISLTLTLAFCGASPAAAAQRGYLGPHLPVPKKHNDSIDFGVYTFNSKTKVCHMQHWIRSGVVDRKYASEALPTVIERHTPAAKLGETYTTCGKGTPRMKLVRYRILQGTRSGEEGYVLAGDFYDQ